MTAYSKIELLICQVARLLEDGSTLAVGTGMPCAAAMLAQKTYAPNLTLFFEAGGIGPILTEMPITVGNSRTFFKGISTAVCVDFGIGIRIYHLQREIDSRLINELYLVVN